MENSTDHEHIDEKTRNSLTRIEGLFTSLVEEVPKHLFKEIKLPVLKKIDMTGWKRSRIVLYKLSSPFYNLIDFKSGYSLLIGFFWLMSSFIWFGLLFSSIDIIHNQGVQSNNGGATIISVEYIIISIFGIISIFVSLLSYWRIIEFLRDIRLPRWFKFFWIFFELVGVFILFYFEVAVPSQQSLNILLSSSRGIAYLLLIFLLGWLPLFNYLFGNLWDVGALLFQLIHNFLERMFKMHKPINTKVVLNLITAPIPFKNTPLLKWKLVELTKRELETIREWAIANRENTEKKFTPTLVTVAVIGLFSNTETFNNIIVGLLKHFRDTFSKSPFGSLELFVNNFATSLVAIIVLLFMALLIIMFENLIVQGTIIEACTVALFVNEDISGNKQEKENPQKSFIKHLFDYFS